MEDGVERSRTERIPVATQLRDDPETEDGPFGGMMEDVQANEAAVEIAVGHVETRYRASMLDGLGALLSSRRSARALPRCLMQHRRIRKVARACGSVVESRRYRHQPLDALVPCALLGARLQTCRFGPPQYSLTTADAEPRALPRYACGGSEEGARFTTEFVGPSVSGTDAGLAASSVAPLATS